MTSVEQSIAQLKTVLDQLHAERAGIDRAIGAHEAALKVLEQFSSTGGVKESKQKLDAFPRMTPSQVILAELAYAEQGLTAEDISKNLSEYGWSNQSVNLVIALLESLERSNLIYANVPQGTEEMRWFIGGKP